MRKKNTPNYYGSLADFKTQSNEDDPVRMGRTMKQVEWRASLDVMGPDKTEAYLKIKAITDRAVNNIGQYTKLSKAKAIELRKEYEAALAASSEFIHKKGPSGGRVVGYVGPAEGGLWRQFSTKFGGGLRSSGK